jgi:hypothetical protein
MVHRVAGLSRVRRQVDSPGVPKTSKTCARNVPERALNGGFSRCKQKLWSWRPTIWMTTLLCIAAEIIPSGKDAVGDLITIHGQVQHPDGRPAAGAGVTVRRIYWTSSVKWRPVALTIADAEGRSAAPRNRPGSQPKPTDSALIGRRCRNP